MKLFPLVLTALSLLPAAALPAQSDARQPTPEELGEFEDFVDEAPASPYHAGDFFGFIEAILSARIDHYASLRAEPLDRGAEAPPGWRATVQHPAVRSAIVEYDGFHALVGQYHDRESAREIYQQLASALTQFALSYSPLQPTEVRQYDTIEALESAAWASPLIDGYQIYYGLELVGDFDLPEDGAFVPRRVYLVRLHIRNLRPIAPAHE